MKEEVQGSHEEIPLRHPLAVQPLAAILRFVGGRMQPGTRDQVVADPLEAVRF
jgi:hypothetical protein